MFCILSTYFYSSLEIRGLLISMIQASNFIGSWTKVNSLLSCGSGSNSLNDSTDVYLCVCHTCHRVRIQPINCERAKWLEGSFSPLSRFTDEETAQTPWYTSCVFSWLRTVRHVYMSRGSQKRIFEVEYRTWYDWRMIRTKKPWKLNDQVHIDFLKKKS